MVTYMSSRKITVIEALKDDFKEDEKNMYFTYFVRDHSFTLIYNKDKDHCILLKNGKAADLKLLSEEETLTYKDVLQDLCRYHHDNETLYYN